MIRAQLRRIPQRDTRLLKRETNVPEMFFKECVWCLRRHLLRRWQWLRRHPKRSRNARLLRLPSPSTGLCKWSLIKACSFRGLRYRLAAGRSHCGGKYSLHGIVMEKPLFFSPPLAELVRLLSSALCCTAALLTACFVLFIF